MMQPKIALLEKWEIRVTQLINLYDIYYSHNSNNNDKTHY